MTGLVAPTPNPHFNGNPPNDFENDAVTPDALRDPPGQKSVYILPGDTEDERYRMTTFSRFPSNQVDVGDLARSGFFYTGYRDRVKCFSCGVVVEQWNSTDDPSARKWHFVHCEFYSGVPGRNKPSGNQLRHLIHHRGGSAPQSSSSASTGGETSRSPPALVTTTPSHQNRQGTSNNNNTAIQAHANMIIVSDNNTSLSPVSMRNQTSLNTYRSSTPSSGYNNHQLFSCNSPANPHMRTLQKRLDTFVLGWRSSRVRASPQQLAESGLFYLGQRDRMKCWYCNGGLQNWEFNDDPWFEHAKWFPTCDYLLRSKGPDYVHAVTRQFPNLRRPTIRSSGGNQVLSGLNMVQSPPRRGMDHSPRQSHRSGAPIQIIDPRKEVKTLKRKANEEMTKSPNLVMAAESMGFKKAQVKAAYMRKLQSGSAFRGFEELVDCIINFCETVSSDDDDDDEDERMPYSASPSRASPLTPNEEIRRLEEEKLCKICRERNFEVVFLPCGHLASCTQCSQNATHCPICKVFVAQKVRTYAS